MKKSLLAILGMSLVCAGSALAVDITIYDQSGYMGAGQSAPGVGEDTEVEPASLWGDVWDLEAYLLEGTTLSMVGNYNFISYPTADRWESGHIFIDVDGSVGNGFGDANPYDQTSNGSQTINNSQVGTYDYAVVMNIDTGDPLNGSYDVYALDGDTDLLTSYYRVNEGSNPWRVAGVLDPVRAVFSGTLEYITGLSNVDVGFDGNDSHYQVNLLGMNASLTSEGALYHYTMECGNDNMMGRVGPNNVTVPDGGLTLGLLGLSLFALEGLRRRFLS